MIAPPKRRWLRFGLRTMFVVVTIIGVWLGWQLSIVRERKAIIDEMQRGKPSGFSYLCVETIDTDPEYDFITKEEFDRIRVPYIRRLLRDNSYYELRLPIGIDAQLIERVEEAFPESRLCIMESDDPYELGEAHFRDSLYTPIDEREPNVGTIFKTGLIEK